MTLSPITLFQIHWTRAICLWKNTQIKIPFHLIWWDTMCTTSILHWKKRPQKRYELNRPTDRTSGKRCLPAHSARMITGQLNGSLTDNKQGNPKQSQFGQNNHFTFQIIIAWKWNWGIIIKRKTNAVKYGWSLHDVPVYRLVRNAQSWREVCGMKGWGILFWKYGASVPPRPSQGTARFPTRVNPGGSPALKIGKLFGALLRLRDVDVLLFVVVEVTGVSGASALWQERSFHLSSDNIGDMKRLISHSTQKLCSLFFHFDNIMNKHF